VEHTLAALGLETIRALELALVRDLQGGHVARNWQAVADAINTRLAEQGMTQKALAELSGVSTATLRKIQKGEPGDRGKPVLMALSVALEWPPGHLQAVSGDEQAPVDPTQDLREQVAAIRADLDAVHDRLAQVEAAQRDHP
jgi:transcriptional regulator with XRE-family HTH domain